MCKNYINFEFFSRRMKAFVLYYHRRIYGVIMPLRIKLLFF